MMWEPTPSDYFNAFINYRMSYQGIKKAQHNKLRRNKRRGTR